MRVGRALTALAQVSDREASRVDAVAQAVELVEARAPDRLREAVAELRGAWAHAAASRRTQGEALAATAIEAEVRALRKEQEDAEKEVKWPIALEGADAMRACQDDVRLQMQKHLEQVQGELARHKATVEAEVAKLLREHSAPTSTRPVGQAVVSLPPLPADFAVQGLG